MKYFLLVLLSMQFAWAIDLPINLIDFQQNPSSIEWQQIQTEHFQLIFPKDISDDAQRVAHLLEKAYPYVSRSQEVMPPKISLVLQNQTTISNAFVTLAPRRSEFFITPSIDPELTNTEWLKTLSIHEFRHVVQFQKSRRGFNKFLQIILGEVGQAVGIGLTVPPWYLEGDAVGVETALTRGGRGRLPLFERDLRAILLSGRMDPYDKTHMGSYKDYLPNHYVYGYFHTSYLRNTYGDLFLSKIFNQSAETSYNPISFYNAIDKLSQKTFEDNFSNLMHELVQEWKKKQEELKPTPYIVQNLKTRYGWSNYLYPQVTNDKKMFALKNGLSFINQFVLIDGKEEKRLFYPGPLMNEYPYKVRNDRFAFVEYEFDPRWGVRDYARLKVYDIKRDEFVLDKRKTKLRLAVLNPSGDKILATEWDENQEQYIVVMDINGSVFNRISYPKEEVITSLDWLNAETAVLVTKNRNDLKSLVEYSLINHQKKVLVNDTLNNLGFVTAEEGHILIESPQSGIDNIFLFENGKLNQLTSSRLGAYAPTLKDDQLYYNEYTVDGMDLAKKDLHWKSEQKSDNSFFPYFEKFATHENFKSLEEDYKKQDVYQIERYSQFKHAFNLHSWILLAPPLSNTVTVQGFSRDILNKFTLTAGAEYNLNEKSTTAFTSAIWSHWYPVFDLAAAYGNRRQNIIKGGKTQTNRWEETSANLGASIPWKKISGRFVHNLKFRGFSKIIKVTDKVSNDRSELTYGAMHSPGANLDYTLFSRTARRDIYPNLGFAFFGHVEEGKNIQGPNQRGAIQSIDTRYYLPGVWYHHSFFHQFAYERQNNKFYQYSSRIFYPRGTNNVFLPEFTKYSANYTMPFFYPDWSWSRYIYLKRVYGNLFYDELNGRDHSFNYKAASTGWEVIFETHFLRLFFPISWGVRGNYVLNGLGNKQSYELFLSSIAGQF
ncbi:MAG: hypothetical protein AB7I27_18545 [Bacteriovoracaceae bacterium]